MTELEAHTRADQIVQHHLSDPLELRSFVARCLLADAHIAAQDATIATLEANKIAAHEVIRLLRAEVRAWRKWLDEMRKSIGDVAIAQKTPSLDMARDAVSAAMIATDAANALEGP